jgi:hypothetical protein
MLGRFIQKQIKPFVKPALKNLTAGLQKYNESIQLEADEVTVAGLILLNDGKIKISSCTMKKGTEKLEVARHLHCWDVEQLAEMLTKNIDKVDLSEMLTDQN